MHPLFATATLAALSAVALAQSPLTTLFADDNFSAVGGCVYFDLNVTAASGITITGLDVNLVSAAGTVGSIELYTCPATRTGNQLLPGNWTLFASGAVTAAGAGLPSLVALSPAPLAFGAHGVALRAVGVGHAYTNGNGFNQNFATAQVALAAGESTNLAFSGTLFAPRVVNCNIRYLIGTAGTVGTRSNYGAGCYDKFASFYEHFAAPAAFDLNNTSLRMVPSAGGYSVQPGTSAYRVPAATATTLALGDDAEVTVALTAGSAFGNSLVVCSNGFVSRNTNGTSHTPTVAALLSAAATGWWHWRDFDPSIAGSGHVKFEEAGGVAYITWDGVWDFGGSSAASASTFQFQFHETTGVVHIVHQTMSGLGTEPQIVGYSPGGPSLDPGNRDLSATLAAGFTTTAPAVAEGPALQLRAVTRPVTGSSCNLQTTNIPAGSTFAVTILSFGRVDPGVSLAAMGAPGCTQYVQPASNVVFVAPVASTIRSVAIPNMMFAVGLPVFAQAVAITPNVNALWLLSSNGVALVVGNL